MSWLIWPGKDLLTPKVVAPAWPLGSVWRGYPEAALRIAGWID